MTLAEELKQKTDSELVTEYKTVMADIALVWAEVPIGKEPNKEQNEKLRKLELESDAYIKEITSRKLYLAEWGEE